MKKFFSIILCAVVVMMTGCTGISQDELSYNRSVRISELETSRKEAEASREAEIEEVDEWGVSLDDVDRLAKDAIRKHEIKSDYRSDYNSATREFDSFLKDIKSEDSVEYSLNDLLEKHNKACKAGIEYIESCIDVKLQYDMYMYDGELDKTEKNLLRTFITLWNPTIQTIEHSKTDMKLLLEPIIEENRTLTDDEIQQVFGIYQILIDNVYKAN